jgi:hypothetical protein
VGQLLAAHAAAVPERRRAGTLLARLLQMSLLLVPGTHQLFTLIIITLIAQLISK